MTTREGVAREAPKNIPPKKLLMVSRFLSNSILLHFHCTLPYAELDFSRGIWAAARDGEEDRVKHLLSRLLPTYPPSYPSLSTTYLAVLRKHCIPIDTSPSSLPPSRFPTKHLLHAIFHPRGTDASQSDNGGYTGLHYAARAGHLHVVRLLLQVFPIFQWYMFLWWF